MGNGGSRAAATVQRKRPDRFSPIGPFEIMPAATYSPTHRVERSETRRKSAHASHGKRWKPRGGNGTKEKARQVFPHRAFRDNAGSDLLSHTVSHAVPSAVVG